MNRNSNNNHRSVESGRSFALSVLAGFVLGTSTTVGLVLWSYFNSEERTEQLGIDAEKKTYDTLLEIVRIQNEKLHKQIEHLEDQIRKYDTETRSRDRNKTKTTNIELTITPR